MGAEEECGEEVPEWSCVGVWLHQWKLISALSWPLELWGLSWYFVKCDASRRFVLSRGALTTYVESWSSSCIQWNGVDENFDSERRAFFLAFGR